MGEIGLIRYVNHPRRVKEWGHHTDWPPQYVNTAHISELGYTDDEIEEVWQAKFQEKVREALQDFFGIDVKKLSLEGLMSESKKHKFWIHSDGTITENFPSSPAW
jgi:hypothetical protein